VIVFFLLVRGVHLSTQWAGYFFLLEMVVLVLVSVVALVTNAGHLSLAPFNPMNISGGLAGFGLGFPVAVYMFIGWENSAALAEETDDPRRNVPKAIYASILLMGLSYLRSHKHKSRSLQRRRRYPASWRCWRSLPGSRQP
jgi:amino acid transporter